MLIQLDGTFIFAIISFLIFLFIIKAILYRPISDILEKREKLFEENSEKEKELKEKSEALIKDKENKIKQARSEACELIKEIVEASNANRSNIIKQTKHEVRRQIEENRNNLERSMVSSKKELKNEVSGFVSLIVSKILNEHTEINIEEEKINKYLNI